MWWKCNYREKDQNSGNCSAFRQTEPQNAHHTVCAEVLAQLPVRQLKLEFSYLFHKELE